MFGGFNESGFFQDSHVVRDGGLGEADSAFDVGGAEPVGFRARLCRSCFERLKDASAGGVGYGLQKRIEVGVRASHDIQEVNLKLMNVNVALRIQLTEQEVSGERGFRCGAECSARKICKLTSA